MPSNHFNSSDTESVHHYFDGVLKEAVKTGLKVCSHGLIIAEKIL